MKRPNKPMETDGRCAPAAHRQGVRRAEVWELHAPGWNIRS